MKFFHSHIVLPDNCKGRMKCIKACPTQAIRLKKNEINFRDDLCVDCGACINICPEKVFVPVIDEISDFEKFEFKIAIPSQILYTQFGSNVHPKLVHLALKKIGFDVVIDITQNIYELSYAISEHIRMKSDRKPIISSFCPAVIRLMQVKYPNLMDLISPFDVPREITAKESKKKFAEEKGININKIGAIYITPCPAKVVSINQPAEKEKSWIDGAISIKDIYGIILPEILKMKDNYIPDVNNEYFYFGKGWGIISQVIQHLDSERCMSVFGIDNIKTVLDDIEDSKLTNVDYLEAFTCSQACIGGVFCVENPYISRHNSFNLEKKFGVPIGFNTKDVMRNYHENYYFMENPILPRNIRSLNSDLSKSIKRMKQKERIFSKLPRKDCGLCGAPTCETFAQDCAWGEADLSECIFFKSGSHFKEHYNGTT